MTTTADRIDTDRSTTPRHTWRTETTTSRTRPVDQGGDTPMMLTQLLDLHEASDALGEAIPCRENDAELWFADTPDGVEFAKALGISRNTLYNLLDQKQGVTASMAVRLEAVLGSSAEMWLGMQTAFELAAARKHQDQIRVTPVRKAG